MEFEGPDIYKDGWTDPVNGYIISEDEIKPIRLARLSWASEKVGIALIKASYFIDNLVDSTLGEREHPDPAPKPSRIIGASFLSIAGVTTATLSIKFNQDISSFVASSPDHVNSVMDGMIDSLIVRPLESLSSARY